MCNLICGTGPPAISGCLIYSSGLLLHPRLHPVQPRPQRRPPSQFHEVSRSPAAPSAAMAASAAFLAAVDSRPFTARWPPAAALRTRPWQLAAPQPSAGASRAAALPAILPRHPLQRSRGRRARGCPAASSAAGRRPQRWREVAATPPTFTCPAALDCACGRRSRHAASTAAAGPSASRGNVHDVDSAADLQPSERPRSPSPPKSLVRGLRPRPAHRVHGGGSLRHHRSSAGVAVALQLRELGCPLGCTAASFAAAAPRPHPRRPPLRRTTAPFAATSPRG